MRTSNSQLNNFFAEPQSFKPSSKSNVDKTTGEKKQIRSEQEYEPATLREEFKTAHGISDRNRLIEIMRRILNFDGTNNGGIREFFRTGLAKEDKATIDDVFDLARFGAGEEKDLAKNLLKRYLTHNKASVLNAMEHGGDLANPNILEDDIKKIIDSMIDFATSDDTGKEKAAENCVVAMGIPLTHEVSMAKLLNPDKSPHAALIKGLSTSAHPSLRMLYNIVFKELALEGCQVTSFDALFRRSKGDTFSKDDSGTMLDQLFEQYLLKNKLADPKTNMPHSRVKIPAESVFSQTRYSDSIGIDADDNELSQKLNIAPGFDFTITRFLRKIAENEVNGAFKEYTDALKILTYKRAQVLKGIAVDNRFTDLSTEKKRKEAEDFFTQQQEALIDALKSPKTLGAEAHSAIREHMQNPEVVTNLILGLYEINQIMTDESVDIFAGKAIAKIQDELELIQIHPLEITDPETGLQRPCTTVRDIEIFCLEKKDLMSQNSKALADQILGVALGQTGVIDTAHPVFGSTDRDDIFTVAQDVNDIFEKLRDNYDIRARRANLDRTIGIIDSIGAKTIFPDSLKSTTKKGQATYTCDGKNIKAQDVEKIQSLSQKIRDDITKLKTICTDKDHNRIRSYVSEVNGRYRLDVSPETRTAITELKTTIAKQAKKTAELKNFLNEINELEAMLDQDLPLTTEDFTDPNLLIIRDLNSRLAQYAQTSPVTAGRLDKFFRDGAGQLPENTDNYGGTGYYSSLKSYFFNEIYKGNYSSSGGEFRSILTSQQLDNVIDGLKDCDISDPHLTDGKKALLRVMIADNKAHSNHRKTQTEGPLSSLLHTTKIVESIDGNGNRITTDVPDDNVRFVALMEMRKRALTIVGNNDRAIAEIDRFIFVDCLQGSIDENSRNNLDLQAVSNILGSYSIDPEISDNNIYKAYRMLTQGTSRLVQGAPDLNSGINQVTSLVDLCDQLETVVIGGSYARIAKHSNEATNNLVRTIYTEDEYMKVGPVISNAIDKIGVAVTQIKQLGSNATVDEKMKILNQIGVDFNYMKGAKLNSLPLLLDFAKTNEYSFGSFINLLMDIAKKLMSSIRTESLFSTSNNERSARAAA